MLAQRSESSRGVCPGRFAISCRRRFPAYLQWTVWGADEESTGTLQYPSAQAEVSQTHLNGNRYSGIVRQAQRARREI
jgi:hypothetical protein